MQGHKTGGRAAGTPNKRTADLADRLKALKCDPVKGLAAIAADPATDTALRARVYADLLPYLYPKRKAVELSGPDGGAVAFEYENAREEILRRLCPEMFATDGAGGGL